ncbi:MAG: hypothetical protein AAGD92_15165 [Pseudomonadota bacterium]
MDNLKICNPHSAGEVAVIPKPESGPQSKPEKSWRGLKAALGYMTWGVGDAFYNADLYGIGYEPEPEAITRAVMIGIPSALMVMRNGFVSAGLLACFAVSNGVSHVVATANGDPTLSYAYGAAHFLFALAFARTGFAFFKERKRA